ncbi:MAG: translation elongation factor Ts [Lachnospiraceae bacterium]|jgi:elongation factor Ts|nr:translation elongation factor Ts [Lachnospiraceae bacterium]
MAITAAQVKELRDISGAGMMDCKKALTESNGDMDAAVEFLRKNGQAKAEKKANRIAAEGLTRIAADGNKKAAVVEVNSETDFVAKNEKFINYVEKVAKQALDTNVADMDAFMAEKWEDDPSVTVSEQLVNMIAVISEKLSIRRFEKIEAPEGLLATYVHDGGRISVVVVAKTAVVNDEVSEAVRNVAMQVAALNPKYIDVKDVPEEEKDHEKEILLAQAVKENEELPEGKRKPQQILEKMLIGRLNKELKEICLNDQIYVKAEDGKQTVSQFLDEVGRRNGTQITITKFVRYEVGEGMEKKQENFAEEVMAQAHKA